MSWVTFGTEMSHFRGIFPTFSYKQGTLYHSSYQNGHCTLQYPVKDQTVHLGICRNTNDNLDIDEKINIGRRTAYSLIGAGFHGRLGIKQSINVDMWRKYIIPRLTFGLEVLNLKKKDINALEAFQVRCVKQLQGLPTKTANSSALALLGLLPVEACINNVS